MEESLGLDTGPRVLRCGWVYCTGLNGSVTLVAESSRVSLSEA
jgi:hypothetical protein